MSVKQEKATAGLESERSEPRQPENQESPRSLKVFDRLESYLCPLVKVTLSILILVTIVAISSNGHAKLTGEVQGKSLNQQLFPSQTPAAQPGRFVHSVQHTSLLAAGLLSRVPLA